jgi:hypothetical protein
MSSTTDKYEANGIDSHDMENGDGLRELRAAQSITMSPELFEKLYLSPPNRVKGNLRKTFANPTPLALIGFLLSLMPLSADLMGWRGAGGFGVAHVYVTFAAVRLFRILTCHTAHLTFSLAAS